MTAEILCGSNTFSRTTVRSFCLLQRTDSIFCLRSVVIMPRKLMQRRNLFVIIVYICCPHPQGPSETGVVFDICEADVRIFWMVILTYARQLSVLLGWWPRF